ncbi:MAG: inositol monophosphatase family protein [Rhodothermales bacterium]
MSVYEEALQVAVRAAIQAGHLIKMHAGKINEGQIRLKNVHDLVTEIDEQSQKIIVASLLEAFPDSTIMAEEGDVFSKGNEKVKGLRWIIDPIDGTTNFTHGMPPYAVSIGLEDNGELVAGVVLEVGKWELFTAVKGGGLYVDGVRAGVSSATALSDSLVVTGFPYKHFDHLEAYLSLLGDMLQSARGVRRTGSASVDLAYVAAGRFDGFFETGLMPWDLAAGVLLINEAGGKVTNYADEPNRLFDKQVLATNGKIHTQMLDLVRVMKDIRL